MLPLRDLYGTFMVFLLGLLHCFLLVCRWPSDVGVTSYFRFFLQQRYSSDDLFDKATKDINKKVVFITFCKFQGNQIVFLILVWNGLGFKALRLMELFLILSLNNSIS